MFNSTYGAGYRSGMEQPTLRSHVGNIKIIYTPACPFPAWRFVSCALWQSGRFDGMRNRLLQPIKKGK